MDIKTETSSLKPIAQAFPTQSSNLAQQEFQRMILEVEDYAIIMLDPTGIVSSWNKGAERIKGYRAEEIIGKSYRLFYPTEDSKNGLPEELLNSARKFGRTNHEGWRVRKDGTRFWGSITMTAIHDEQNNIKGFIKVTRDLTDRKIAQDRYNNALDELKLKNEELRREEEKYHKMISEIRDYAIILLDTDGTVLDWNKGAEKLKGYAPHEIIGKNFRLFYAQEDRDTNLPQRLLQQALQNGTANHEGYRIKKDGSRFWGNVAITALHDHHGKIIGFSKVTKDLTDRKIADDRLAIFTQELQQKNEALRSSEERYHRMIAEVKDYAIILLDPNGKIQNWNAGAELIKGYSAVDAIGKSFKIFYTDDDIKVGVPDKLLGDAESTGIARSEGWRKRKDGTLFWGSIVITALHDKDGNVIGFSKVTRDLTASKAAEDSRKQYAMELELKNHELQRLNAELTSFSYVVSHDLKEPVRKIQVFASRQLEPDKSPEQLKEFSQKIMSTAARMQIMMESLLTYAMISNDTTSREAVDLNTVLANVKSDLEIRIAEVGASIKSDTLPLIQAIPFQMHQLFLNLLSNAIKFCKRDIAPAISITAKPVADDALPKDLPVMNGRQYYQLTFSDNGVGFEADQVNKIFDVFRRLQNKKESAGAGVGLAIVKKVTENHEGLVLAEGEVGVGATFHIYLPGA